MPGEKGMKYVLLGCFLCTNIFILFKLLYRYSLYYLFMFLLFLHCIHLIKLCITSSNSIAAAAATATAMAAVVVAICFHCFIWCTIIFKTIYSLDDCYNGSWFITFISSETMILMFQYSFEWHLFYDNKITFDSMHRKITKYTQYQSPDEIARSCGL